MDCGCSLVFWALAGGAVVSGIAVVVLNVADRDKKKPPPPKG